MAALTENRNTREILNGGIKQTYKREIAANSTIYTGGIIAQNASGKAVAASDATGLLVLGICEGQADGNAFISGGTFLLDNGTSTEQLAVTDIGSVCYVLDDHTVGKVGGTCKVAAGYVADVLTDGVVVIFDPAAGKFAKNAAATTSAAGIVKQAAAVADCTKAGDTLTSAETQLNAALAALRTAGIIAANA